MEDIFGQPIHLFLFVKVSENWAEDRAHYATLGLEYPSEEK
jgi:GTP-binding protein Era